MRADIQRHLAAHRGHSDKLKQQTDIKKHTKKHRRTAYREIHKDTHAGKDADP